MKIENSKDKNVMHLIKNLPEDVEEAWWYEGKDRSIHIVLKPVVTTITLANGLTLNYLQTKKQINISF